LTHLCPDCRRVKHLLSLYNTRVYDVLEQVLIRNTLKQEHKIKVEIKSDITKKEKMLKKPDCMGASS
jgi:hypothetical protein